MSPRLALYVLGLGNLVAGALVALAPAVVLSAADGRHSTSARLLGGSLAVMLVAVGSAGWLLPPEARRAYLWIFGVAVKAAAALLWGATALATGLIMLAAGAVADLAVALAIAGILRASRALPGETALEEPVNRDASREDGQSAQ